MALPSSASRKRLSDERTFTRVAEVKRVTEVRSKPNADSRAITLLHRRTEDRWPEVYLLLRSRERVKGHRWVKLRLPGRPNGRTGWVPADALRKPMLTRKALVLDRSRLRVRLLRRGKVVWSRPSGSARRGWRRRAAASGSARSSAPSGIYGPWAFGTSAYSRLSEWPGGGVVGLHGTDQPSLIPGRPSHGCIRFRNADIRYLARHVPVGTPLRISTTRDRQTITHPG